MKLKLLSVHDHAKKLKDDMYADGSLLYCKYCQHARVHTIKQHLECAKHKTNKDRANALQSQSAHGMPGTSGVKTNFY